MGKPSGLARAQTAAKMRDAIEGIAQGMADRNLIIRRAFVKSIAADKLSITAQFVDEPTGLIFEVPVTDKLPTAVDQQVDIAIRNRTDLSIWAVIGAPEIVGTVPDAVPPAVPAAGAGALSLASSGNAVTATWAPLTEADTYELQYDQTPVFDPLSTFSVEVDSNSFTVSDLEVDDVWYFRVRGVNVNGPGDWSGTESITVKGSKPSDGLPPEDSPPVTVEPALHMLTATWPKQPNADAVTYEVHLDTVSGFTPSAATLLGETSGTFWVAARDATGAELDPADTYHIRVVAKDLDGPAAPGAQGSGSPQIVDLGEAGGKLPSTFLDPDGVVPGAPGAIAVTSGIGYLYLTWEPSVSVDAVTYEVHVSEVNNFIPDANTLSFTTTSRFGFLRKQGPGEGSAPLEYGVTYYIKIRGVDADGSGPFGPQASGFTVQTNTADIVAGAITASKIYSGAVMADRIQATNIAADAVRAMHIYSGSVMSERIQASNITTGVISANSALIQNGAIYSAQINTLAASKITTDFLTATLTVSGSIRTSTATQRVEMNSGGLFMYDSGGNPIVSINAATGTAYFQGNIYAVNGTFTGTIESYATVKGGTFQGATFTTRTNGSGQGVTLTSGTDTLAWFNSDNTSGGYIRGQGYGAGANTLTIAGASVYMGIMGKGVYIGSGQVSSELDVRAGVTFYGPAYNGWVVSGAYRYGSEYYHPNNPPPYIYHTHSDGSCTSNNHSHSYSNFSVSGYLQAGSGSGLYTGSHLQVNNSGSPTLFNNGGNTRVAAQGSTDIIYMQDKAAVTYLRVWGGVYSNQSSGKVKEDIVDDPKSALDTAKKLKVKNYRRKYKGAPLERGVIAEELQLIDPVLVTVMPPCTPDDPVGETLGVDVTALAVTALKAVGELAEEVRQLRELIPA